MSSDMELLPNSLLTFVIIQGSQDTSDAWISAISALSGALIGGFSTSLVCFYTIKKEREKEILLRKITLLDEASKKLLIPLIDFRYKLSIADNSGNASDLLFHLRSNRNYFIYCPKNIRIKLEDLYTTIEEKNAILNGEEIMKIIECISEIENEFYTSFVEMKL